MIQAHEIYGRREHDGWCRCVEVVHPDGEITFLGDCPVDDIDQQVSAAIELWAAKQS